MGLSPQTLIAFDTDHIKQYVFGTDRLKEIRGASALLDFLNRTSMELLARQFHAKCIYANGGSGLYLVDAALADDFAKSVQQAYRERSGGTLSLSYAKKLLPNLFLDVLMHGDLTEELMHKDLTEELKLLRWRLRDRKNSYASAMTLISHPFMSLCSSCGLEYAEAADRKSQDDDEQGKRYCGSCLRKRAKDRVIKMYIDRLIHRLQETNSIPKKGSLWERLLGGLLETGYDIPTGTQRPRSLEVFRNFAASERTEKGYLGLIYADANGMGKKLEALHTLHNIKLFADTIDEGIYQSLVKAIKQHIPQVRNVDDIPTFCFDVLLLGGDDIVIVTHASVAMQVATTLAQEFAEWTTQQAQQQTAENLRQQLEKSALSVGVVLAPIKYPFGLLLDLVEGVLKSAKKREAERDIDTVYGDSSLNFMTVTGNTSQSFDDEFEENLRRKEREDYKDIFYATLRPYSLGDMTRLLALITEGKTQKKMGRTKLHQLRDAVLAKNLTTSVVQAIASLRNWNGQQRDFILKEVYPLGRQVYEMDPRTLPTLLSHSVIFPWYDAGTEEEDRVVYRTPLLDFIELYDFVAEGDPSGGTTTGSHSDRL